MPPALRRIAALGLVAAAALSTSPGPAQAAPGPAAPSLSALSLSPSASTGVARPGRVLGPFSLRNDTRVAYDVTVDAVLLAQGRTGAIVVRDDAAARRAASRLLGLQLRRFSLPAGHVRSVGAVVRAVRPRRGVYAGMLFSARPRTREGAGVQITNLLRLDAGQLLAPRDARPAFTFEPIRAEQAAPRRLRLAIPVKNAGNVLGRVAGRVDVLDTGGRRVLRAPIGPMRILPGATVDVPAPLGGRLAAGHYTLRARLLINGDAQRLRGAMDLFGVNTVRAQDARLTALRSPTATKGSPVDVVAAFRNTGNVPYAPGAVVEIRPIDAHGRLGPPVAPHALEVEQARPGGHGRISGSVTLPPGRAFQLNVRLMAGTRELDAQAVRVDVHEAPALAARLEEFLRANAVMIVAAALGLMLAGAVCTIRYVARLKARLARAATGQLATQGNDDV